MLILSRRAGESILVGDDIRIMLVGTKRPGEARIGIEAPKHIRVVREELLERDLTKREKQE